MSPLPLLATQALYLAYYALLRSAASDPHSILQLCQRSRDARMAANDNDRPFRSGDGDEEKDEEAYRLNFYYYFIYILYLYFIFRGLGGLRWMLQFSSGQGG
jgi:hypothetical protein